ncbi:MAG: FliA/WhiG family RNA polymerase sigma factor [Phycisphaeraceae bacterium]|nr:FliA/WhiG family RNA polymerase sigma factor [Phycisphaerales bacterium]MCB9861668.1 FliA/WhiG family RNA polymerase sigma factor [Phycisphaeraceae bacterium]
MQITRRSVRSRSRFAVRHAQSDVSHSPLNNKPIEEVWRDYAKNKTSEVRNFLMEKFLPLVRFNAQRIYARLPDEVDLEDLMSAGMFGLMDAVNSFDLSRGVKFETFCAPRIRGAILDELRSMDWVPRLVRSRSSKMEGARQRIEKEHGRPATDDEVASFLGVDDDEFTKLKRDSRAVSTISITRKASANSDDSRESREIDVANNDEEGNPVLLMQRRDIKELITKGLSRSERLIVILYYFEGMTMREIGATLDLSESRVSQMHSSILARLRVQLQHREKELEEAA